MSWCRAHTALIDKWLHELFVTAGGDRAGVALVAVGGYGREELCPASDIDVMLLHDRRIDGPALAPLIWYPIWDEGWHLGHSVRTRRQALKLAADDLDTATALLSARHIAGDEALTIDLADRARAQWQGASRRWLSELALRVDARHAAAGEVAFRLEPDLKEGRGGMRDVHALHWAETAQRVLFANDNEQLEQAYSVLLDVRVEVQRLTGRAQNILTHQDKPSVAKALGDPSPDALMGRVAEAARAIAWTSDDTWRRVTSVLKGPRGRGVSAPRTVFPGVVERDGEIHVELETTADDSWLVLEVAVASAERNLPIERTTLDRLAQAPPLLPESWPSEARLLFERLLLSGRPAIGVVEALDHHGLWQQLVPEWAHVRARPQHNPYHSFTVDRHLLETIANAADLRAMTDRPDLLVLGALVHDLGKVDDRDHTKVGEDLATTVAVRLGCDAGDSDTLVALVRHHLLLSEVASRRDLDDPNTIRRVANAVESVQRLRLLAALTEADAKATGPAAWSPWKAELVRQLATRVEAYLTGVDDSSSAAPPWPTPADVQLLTSKGHHVEAGDGIVTVCTPDRPGVFSRVAGALALRGLDVIDAIAHSTEDGYALERFRVVDPLRDETPWDRVVHDLDLALNGRLAIAARMAERARSQRSRRSLLSLRAKVHFDNEASDDATVIDVEAPDVVGMLYRITRALGELDLDIRSARVQTLGPNVVDAFYVVDRHGHKILDSTVLAEIERAVVHGVSEGLAAADGTTG